MCVTVSSMFVLVVCNLQFYTCQMNLVYVLPKGHFVDRFYFRFVQVITFSVFVYRCFYFVLV